MANKRNRNRSNKKSKTTTTRKKRGDGAISHSNVDLDAVVHEGTDEILRKESKRKETNVMAPREKIGTLNVPSSILPPPPPTSLTTIAASKACTWSSSPPLKAKSITCSIAKQKLAKSRSHLKGVNLLRKNCIIISGLPKTEFPTIAAIEKFFSRYGKIVLVVENPKGIVAHDCPRTKCRSGRCEQELLQQNDSVVFLSYISEKSANLAIRDINSGKIFSTIPDGRCKRNIVHSTFVYSPYCEKFLKGEHCRDLHCVLMHEDVKSNRNSLSPTSSSGSKSSVAKSFKESYQTPPIILKKERSNVVADSQFSSERFKNTRSFLEVTTGVERKGIEQGNRLNEESGEENIDERNGEIEFGERSSIQHGNYHNGTEHSCSSTFASDEGTALDDDYYDEEDVDDQYKRKIVFQQLIATPDSTLTKSTISSKLTLNTCDQSLNGYCRDGDNNCMESNRSMSEFCAKELFVGLKKDTTSENRTLLALAFPLNEYSPFQHGDDDDGDDDNDDVDISSLQTVKMCTSPWDFQSPLQLEKDNFDTLYTNNLLHISRSPNRQQSLGADRCHLSVNKNHCSTLAHGQNLMASNSMLHTTGKRKNQNESPNKFIGERHRCSQTNSSPLSTKSTGCYPVQQQQQQQKCLFPQDQNVPPMTNYRSFPQQYRQQQNANYSYPPQHLPRANFPFPYPMIGHLQPHGGGVACHPFSNRLHPNCYNPIGQAPIFWWNRM